MPNKDQSPAAERLVDYATRWTLYHLMEIEAEDETEVDEENARIVIEGIFNIFSNKNDSLKPLEQEGTLFLGCADDDECRVSQKRMLPALSMWAKRATRLPQQHLPYGILDWFRPLVQEPLRVCISLSRSHIHNWFSSRNIFQAWQAFRSAHTALREGRNLPELRQNPNLGNYFDKFDEADGRFTEDSFQVVASAFWDIVKTSSSYQGVGMAMKWIQLYKPAVAQLNQGLEDMSLNDLQRVRLLGSKGNTLITIGQQEDDQATKTQYFEEAQITLREANKTFNSLDKDTQTMEQSYIGYNLGFLAHVSVLLGQYDVAYNYMVELSQAKLRCWPALLADIIQALKQADQLKTMLDIYKVLDQQDIVLHLINFDETPLQEAAQRLNEGPYWLGVLESSRKAVELLDLASDTDYKVWCQASAAEFARRALRDNQLSKTLVREYVDSPVTPAWDMYAGCNSLAEIYLEDFRLSKDPAVKKTALDETKRLFDKLELVLPEFKAAESHIMVPLCLMLRRLGPALEFSGRMHEAFRDCVNNLQDDTGANDSDALRRLARVLSCVDGFEKEASVALTCQVYVLDSDVFKKDQELEKRRESESEQDQNETPGSSDATKEATAEISQDDATAARTDDTHMNGNAPSGAPNGTANTDIVLKSGGAEGVVNGETAVEEVKHEMDEGLLESAGFSCNACGKDFVSWTQGKAYLCMCCIDCDLCEECYNKKLAEEKGEIEAPWRMICPQGHRHVIAPVVGWRGVKDGVMRIGTSETPFRSWLAQLEIKWSKHWDVFWTDAETL